MKKVSLQVSGRKDEKNRETWLSHKIYAFKLSKTRRKSVNVDKKVSEEKSFL
jgi:hypothetical protein